MKFVLIKKSKTSYSLLILIFGLLFFTISNLFILNNSANPGVELIPTIVPEVKSAKDQPSPTAPIIVNEGGDLSSIRKEFAKVINVVDGDTIEADFGQGNIKTVRYIGIDTPETVDPRNSVQCFGREASERNKSLVLGNTIGLEVDISNTDKYGRLLRYVYLENTMVNNLLVEEGFAQSSAYPPDIKYQEDFDKAEEQARLGSIGFWGACADPVTSTTQNKNRTTMQLNDKDCSDFATHQEAQNYFESKGGSASNNVDKLDGADRDGQVCETLP